MWGEAPPDACLRCDAAQMVASGRGRPGPSSRLPIDHAEQRPDRHLEPTVEPRPQLLESPVVHPDLAALAALALADEDRAAAGSRSGSVSDIASPIRRAARQSTTISARSRSPWSVSPAWRITATISSTLGGSAG